MENGNVAEIFGEKVFNLPTMKARFLRIFTNHC